MEKLPFLGLSSLHFTPRFSLGPIEAEAVVSLITQQVDPMMMVVEWIANLSINPIVIIKRGRFQV